MAAETSEELQQEVVIQWHSFQYNTNLCKVALYFPCPAPIFDPSMLEVICTENEAAEPNLLNEAVKFEVILLLPSFCFLVMVTSGSTQQVVSIC